jgi:hypothetical protein
MARFIATVVWSCLSIAAWSADAQQQHGKPANPASSAAVTLRGCVAESMGHYLLNNATVVEPKATPVPSPSADPSSVKTADVPPYELIGGQAKAHVGQQVEIVGTMPSDREAAARGSEATPTAHPMAGRVTIKSVKVLTPTCPLTQ